MGFAPRDVDQMGLWEFMACIDGYSAANGGKHRSGESVDVEEADLRAMGIEGF